MLLVLVLRYGYFRRECNSNTCLAWCIIWIHPILWCIGKDGILFWAPKVSPNRAPVALRTMLLCKFPHLFFFRVHFGTRTRLGAPTQVRVSCVNTLNLLVWCFRCRKMVQWMSNEEDKIWPTWLDINQLSEDARFFFQWQRAHPRILTQRRRTTNYAST